MMRDIKGLIEPSILICRYPRVADELRASRASAPLKGKIYVKDARAMRVALACTATGGVGRRAYQAEDGVFFIGPNDDLSCRDQAFRRLGQYRGRGSRADRRQLERHTRQEPNTTA